jgi:hypothetical protein
MRLILTAIAILIGSAAQAVPVAWTLEDVQWSDYYCIGCAQPDTSYLTGSFVYDADTNTFSDIYLISENPPPGGGGSKTYTSDNLLSFDNDSLILLDDSNPAFHWELELNFQSSLTNTGGDISLVSSYEIAYDPNGGGSLERGVDSGGITSMPAVPIPAAVWLFGSALAGLGWLRRYKPSLR